MATITIAKAKRKTKLDVQSKRANNPTPIKDSRTLVTRRQIERLRGRFKGRGLLKSLMDEKRTERER